ncbi:MAG: hypothetical protein ABIT16_06530 [Croceibacterium sp.]
MARAIALTRIATAHAAGPVRLAIVTLCALALIAAGEALPFYPG